ncbi:hydrophobic protein [Kitasatospora sp. NPDC054939]
MVVMALLLVLILVLFGAGFAVEALWWVALGLLVVWLVGFASRGTGGVRRTRWYRW